MKNYLLKIFFALVISLLGISQDTFAQFSNEKLDLDDPNQTHVIVLKSGKKIKGSIKSIKNEDVTIHSIKGDSLMELSLSEIKRIRVKGNMLLFDKNYSSKLPPTLSLFFTNTAFAMKSGERSYRTFWGNSLFYSKQLSKGLEGGLGYSFPIFINGKLKITGKAKDKNRRHGTQLSLALAPIGDPVAVLEISQMNTWGDEDKFLNLTFNFYEIKEEGFSFNPFPVFDPDRYFSIAVGGGFRLGEYLQLHLNKNINFSSEFIDGNLIPSFGLNWVLDKHIVSFGYMSSNDLGFNYYPVFETDFDDLIIFRKNEFAKLPFFSYSRIF